MTLTDTAQSLNGCTPTWAGHGNYPPRYGWISKVQARLTEDCTTFSRPDATIRLGVGTSQTRAMRFWSMAFGLLETTRSPYPFGFTPTMRGDWLLDPDTGADPYQEDPVTQWLLHWWLLSNDACPVPTFHYLIADAPMSTYGRDDALQAVRRAARRRDWKVPSTNQVSRDMTAFLAMYAHTPRDAEPGTATANFHREEDAFNPWRGLNIVLRVPGQNDVIQVNRRAGNRIPKPLLAYTCFDHAARTAPGQHSIALSRLHTDPSGPGRVMLTDYKHLRRALEDAATRHPDLGIDFADSFDGGDRLVWTGSAQHAAERVLAAYYDREDGPPPPPAPTRQDVFEALFDL